MGTAYVLYEPFIDPALMEYPFPEMGRGRIYCG